MDELINELDRKPLKDSTRLNIVQLADTVARMLSNILRMILVENIFTSPTKIFK